ncbi:MAG: class I SAM-dependent rRNA methyltransferase [Bdellovibrionota bacterium]
MALLKIHLHRNLRRTVMRGHPWIYRESITKPPQLPNSQICQVIDSKNEPLAWAMYDPHSPLSLRILSLEKKIPDFDLFETRFADAYKLRKAVVSKQTDSYRLLNGEGDLLPGLICDIYGKIAVLQFDGQGSNEFWDKIKITNWLLNAKVVTSVVEKFRRNSDGGIQLLGGEKFDPLIIATENGVKFKVDIENGQKTGFFLDQRENRNYIRSVSKDSTVLNLFSYTGGFSIYAGLGGAKNVASLDVAQGAIDLANESWKLNGLNPADHTGLCVDVFEYLKSNSDRWDHVIVDPPSMGHSEDQKDRAKAKYIELFTAAMKKVKPQGQISLSSCSSHISFEDFYEIMTEALSESRRRGRILRVSGQGPDHPFPHSAKELQYLKFIHLVLN